MHLHYGNSLKIQKKNDLLLINYFLPKFPFIYINFDKNEQ